MLPLSQAPPSLSTEQLIAQFGGRGGAIDQMLEAAKDETHDFERHTLVRRARYNWRMVKGDQFIAPGFTQDAAGNDILDYTTVDGFPDPDDNGATITFAYPLNVLRQELSIFIAVMGQSAARVKAVADDPEDTDQLEMAKDADATLRDWWEKIKADQRQGVLAFHLYTTGPIFGHVVFVRDRIKYGAVMEPSIGIQEGPDGTPVPIPGEPKEYVNGDAELRLHTVLDVSWKFGAKDLTETPFLDLQVMLSKWKLIQEYSQLEQYRDSDPPDEDTQPSDVTAAEARDSSGNPSGVGRTKRSGEWRFRQIWCDPELFEAVKDDSAREILKRQFPEGIRIDRVGSITVDLAPEAKSDVWVVCKIGLGEKIGENALISDSIPFQRAINDLFGLAIETVLRAITRTIVSQELLDRKAIESNEAVPGEIVFALPTASGRLTDGIAPLPVAQVSNQLVPLANLLQSLMQDVSGFRMELAGGGPPTNTFREAKQRKDQALQRLAPQAREIASFWEKVAELGIKTRAKYGAGTIKAHEKTHFGTQSRTVDLAQLSESGWHTEADEGLPMTFADRSDHLYSLMKEYPEMVQQLLGLFDPMNLETNLELLQLSDHQSPYAQQKKKTLADIQELMRAAPIPGPDGSPEPSIPIDPFDDHDFAAKFLSVWLIAAAVRGDRQQNPQGFDNVVAFWQAHQSAARPVPPPVVRSSLTVNAKASELSPDVLNEVLQGAGMPARQGPPIEAPPQLPAGKQAGKPQLESPLPPLPAQGADTAPMVQ